MEPVVRRVAAATTQVSAPTNSAAITAAYSVTDPNATAALPSNDEPSSIESSMLINRHIVAVLLNVKYNDLVSGLLEFR